MNDKKKGVQKSAADIAAGIEAEIATYDYPDQTRMDVIRELEAGVPASPPQSEVTNAIIEEAKQKAADAGLDPSALLLELGQKANEQAAPLPPELTEGQEPTPPVMAKKGAK